MFIHECTCVSFLETTMKHLSLPENQTIVRILPGEEKDIVTVFGETYVLSFNFQHPQQVMSVGLNRQALANI